MCIRDSSNPSQEIIAEAHDAFGAEQRVACLLSLGCGHPGVFVVPESPESANWNQFLERLATNGEQKAQSMESQLGLSGIYHRFSVIVGLERSADTLSPGDIVTHAAAYLADVTVSRKMDICIDLLKERDGILSLEQLSMSYTRLRHIYILIHDLEHTEHQTNFSPQFPPLTKTFVMRQEPWDFIHKTILGPRDPDDIDGPRMLFVTGMGGCGKTQLVLRFVKINRAE